MFHRLRWLLLGAPLPTGQEQSRRLDNIRALAVFSPDALSSIAYANQEIYLGLAIAGSAALSYSFPIALAIAGLLVILSLSYFQTIHGYPSGGGSYIVARENLGTFFGLTAGAALLLDYLLTAAVSISAAVAAITSVFPHLWEHRILLALFLLGLITILNLRGVQETGSLVAFPVYAFILTYFLLLIIGAVRILRGDLAPLDPMPILVSEPITLFLLLHAFSTGCTALTGIEAISNGVQAFRPPEARNAGKTLMVMAAIMAVLFLGTIGLTQYLNITPGPQETILSALARQAVGSRVLYLIIQASTMGILVVAANTSFAGFPRVSSILARDRFLPKQFMALGDRLVFSTGIVFLAAACGVMLLLFNAETHRLVPLFAVGAFLAFLLSQTGMVVHWWRTREKNWGLKAALNCIGAALTLVTLIVVGVTKFIDGAWISLLLIAGLVYMFYRIQGHYLEVSSELTIPESIPSTAPPSQRIVIPVSGLHNGVVGAIQYARSFSNDITAVYVEIEPHSGEALQKKWNSLIPDIPLAVVPSPYRSLVGPFLEFLDKKDAGQSDGQLSTVIIPEYIPAKWWQGFLHNQSAWTLRLALLYRRRALGYQRVIIDVPVHLKY